MLKIGPKEYQKNCKNDRPDSTIPLDRSDRKGRVGHQIVILTSYNVEKTLLAVLNATRFFGLLSKEHSQFPLKSIKKERLSDRLGCLALVRYEAEADFLGSGPHDRHSSCSCLGPKTCMKSKTPNGFGQKFSTKMWIISVVHAN